VPRAVDLPRPAHARPRDPMTTLRESSTTPSLSPGVGTHAPMCACYGCSQTAEPWRRFSSMLAVCSYAVPGRLGAATPSRGTAGCGVATGALDPQSLLYRKCGGVFSCASLLSSPSITRWH
jgi:hypothetical protein